MEKRFIVESNGSLHNIGTSYSIEKLQAQYVFAYEVPDSHPGHVYDRIDDTAVINQTRLDAYIAKKAQYAQDQQDKQTERANLKTQLRSAVNAIDSSNLQDPIKTLLKRMLKYMVGA